MIGRLVTALVLPLLILLAIILTPTDARHRTYNPIIAADMPQEPGAVIPYSDLLTDGGITGIELTRHGTADSAKDTPADSAVRERLDRKLIDVMLVDQGFEKAIGFFRDATNTNIFVNWTALEQVGVDRNSPVSLQRRDITFQDALAGLLASLRISPPAGEPTAIGFIIDDGVITISTADDLESAKYEIVRVYDLRDMLRVSHDGTQKTAQEVIELIEKNVAPQSWRDKGGQVGTIHELNGQLIINQTSSNQRAISKLLKALRENHEP